MMSDEDDLDVDELASTPSEGDDTSIPVSLTGLRDALLRQDDEALCKAITTPGHQLTLEPLPVALRERAVFKMKRCLDYFHVQFKVGIEPFVSHEPEAPNDGDDHPDQIAAPRIDHYLEINRNQFGRPLKLKSGTLDYDIRGATAFLGELDNLGGLWIAIVDRDRPHGEKDANEEEESKYSPMKPERLALVAEHMMRTLQDPSLISAGGVYKAIGKEQLDWSQIPIFINLFMKTIGWLKNLLGPWGRGKSVVFVINKFGQDLNITSPMIKHDPAKDDNLDAPDFDYDNYYRPGALLDLKLLKADCTFPRLMEGWALGGTNGTGNMTGRSSPQPFEFHIGEINDDKASAKNNQSPLRLVSLNLYSMLKQTIRPTAGSHEIVRGKMTAGLSMSKELLGKAIWDGDKRKQLSRDVAADQPYQATLRAVEKMSEGKDLKGIRFEHLDELLLDAIRDDPLFKNFSCIFKDYLVPAAMAVHDTILTSNKYIVLYDPKIWPGALLTITEVLLRPITRIKEMRKNVSEPVPFVHREIVALFERLIRHVHTGSPRCVPVVVGRNTGITSSLLADGWPCINTKVLDPLKLKINLLHYTKGRGEGNLQLAHVSAAPYTPNDRLFLLSLTLMMSAFCRFFFGGTERLKSRFTTFALHELEMLLMREEADESGSVPKTVLKRMVRVLVDDIGNSLIDPMIAKYTETRHRMYRKDIENSDKVLSGERLTGQGQQRWPLDQREAVASDMRLQADEMDQAMKMALDDWKKVAKYDWHLGFTQSALLELNRPFDTFTPEEAADPDAAMVRHLYVKRTLTFDSLARGLLHEAIPQHVIWPASLQPVGHPTESPWITQIDTLYDAFCYTGPRINARATGFGAETLVTMVADILRQADVESWPSSGHNQHRPDVWYQDHTRWVRIVLTGMVAQHQEPEPVLTPRMVEDADRENVEIGIQCDLTSESTPKFLVASINSFLAARTANDPTRGRYLRRILDTFDWTNPAHK
ncbi:hypothetical protein P7C70_g7785, partial [Phenoliferia sp. Uapishka_3]